MVGGTPTPRSLQVLGDPYGQAIFSGQHDARVLPDGSLTVHDNGTNLDRPPRAVRYRIDEEALTATLLEDVRDTRAPSSGCCGGARKLPAGNWVVSWGAQPTVGEYTPSGAPVLRLTFTAGAFSYRAFPVEPGRLERSVLRDGMDAMAIR
jgi:hypothetical protein